MNKLLLFLTTVLLLSACGNTADNEFIVKGNIANAKGKTLFISEFSDYGFSNIDSTVINPDGGFSLSGRTSIPNFYALRIAPNEFITVLLDSADVITVSANADSFMKNYKIEGSKSMELMNKLNTKIGETHAKIDSLGNIFLLNENSKQIDSIKTVLDSEFEQLRDSQKEFSTDFINNNINSIACLIALEQKITNRIAVFTLQNDLDIFEKVDSSLSKLYPQSAHVKNLHKTIVRFKQRPRKQSKSANAGYKIGDILPDISMKNPSGDIISLYSLRGKYVLLDFWAAWCMPCRQANQNLVGIYKQYKDKNFTIYQVSLDKEKDMWTAAIKKDNIASWHHVSDLLFWQSEAVKVFGVKSIPFNFLIDPDGKLVAVNLHGKALSKKLQELL